MDAGVFRRHAWAYPIEALMAAGVVYTLLAKDWLHFSEATFALLVSFAPVAYERIVKVKLVPVVHVLYAFFILISMFAGESMGFYGRFTHWDDGVHFISGLLVGTGAALWLSTLLHAKSVRMPLWLSVVVIASVSAGIAVLWEIIEFTSDQLFGTHSQDDSLLDTMTDLIYGSGGGLVIAFLFRLHLKGYKVFLLSQLISYQVKVNA